MNSQCTIQINRIQPFCVVHAAKLQACRRNIRCILFLRDGKITYCLGHIHPAISKAYVIGFISFKGINPISVIGFSPSNVCVIISKIFTDYRRNLFAAMDHIISCILCCKTVPCISLVTGSLIEFYILVFPFMKLCKFTQSLHMNGIFFIQGQGLAVTFYDQFISTCRQKSAYRILFSLFIRNILEVFAVFISKRVCPFIKIQILCVSVTEYNMKNTF